MKYKPILLAAAILVFIAVGSGYEAKSVRNRFSVNAPSPAQVSLSAAVTVAEHHVGGKALSAEFDLRNGQWVVGIVEHGDKKLMDVEVDAASGRVIAAVEDKVGHLNSGHKGVS